MNCTPATQTPSDAQMWPQKHDTLVTAVTSDCQRDGDCRQQQENLCDRVWTEWEEHAQSLRRYLQSRTREQALTDDLLSDLLLKTYKNCERLAGVKDVRAWLMRVAQNRLTDHYRKPRLEPLPEIAVEGSIESSNTPEQRLAVCMGEMLLLLPEADRLPLQWADLEGVAQQEVARRLGVGVSGAKSRIQRARRKLRQQLEDCCRVELDALGRVYDFQPRNKC